jgi:hypothetical protein
MLLSYIQELNVLLPILNHADKTTALSRNIAHKSPGYVEFTFQKQGDFSYAAMKA